jgi:uncharacterized membrane protein YgcG
MKRILFTVLSGLLLAGLALAQNQIPPGTAAQPQTSSPQGSQQIPNNGTTQQPSQAPAQSPTGMAASNAAAHPTRIAPGSILPVQLTKTVDAKKVKPGQEVVATVTMDMKNNNGDVIVPKDTKIIGHVTEAQPRSKEQKESQMGIAFDHAVMKDGNQMEMPMSIQAIIGQQNNNQNQGNSGGGNSGGQEASAPSGGGMSSPGGGNSTPSHTGASGASQPSQPSAPSASSEGSAETSNSAGARPQITGQTKGVVGISNLNLASGPNGNQGSVMTSEKNNVKLESGTMMLLKVN